MKIHDKNEEILTIFDLFLFVLACGLVSYILYIMLAK